MAAYEFEVWEHPLSLHFAVNNVFDVETFSGSFGPNPLREWTLTARYKF